MNALLASENCSLLVTQNLRLLADVPLQHQDKFELNVGSGHSFLSEVSIVVNPRFQLFSCSLEGRSRFHHRHRRAPTRQTAGVPPIFCCGPAYRDGDRPDRQYDSVFSPRMTPTSAQSAGDLAAYSQRRNVSVPVAQPFPFTTTDWRKTEPLLTTADSIDGYSEIPSWCLTSFLELSETCRPTTTTSHGPPIVLLPRSLGQLMAWFAAASKRRSR